MSDDDQVVMDGDDEVTSQALAPIPAGTILTMGPFCLGPMSMTPRRDATFAEWNDALAAVNRIHGAAQFWLGDLIEYGESRWGQKYAQAVDATDYDIKTLTNAAWIARQIPPERRRMSARVSFSHHAEVAGLEPEQQEYWLQRVEAEALTRDALRTAIRQQAKAQKGFVGEFWLLVKCTNEVDQANLAERMQQEGRTVKPQ